MPNFLCVARYKHCMKSSLISLLSVSMPNGLIAHMFGPVEGRRHDAFILPGSCLLSKLKQFKRPNGEPYFIYGDPAYGVTAQVLSPYRTNGLTAAEQEFNRRMSAVRVSVEWTFDKVLQYFSFLDYKKSHKVLLQPTGKYYLVGALLTNCHTCLYGSQTSSFF